MKSALPVFTSLPRNVAHCSSSWDLDITAPLPLPWWKGPSTSKWRQLASCRGWKETTPIKRKHAEFPYRPAESPVWRHRNDPGRVRKTRFGFEPEGHQERKGPSSQPQVECFTCQACRTALQNLGLPMRLQARFLAVLSTPQEIGCLWSFQQVAATCIAHSSHSFEALSQPVGATRALTSLPIHEKPKGYRSQLMGAVKAYLQPGA